MPEVSAAPPGRGSDPFANLHSNYVSGLVGRGPRRRRMERDWRCKRAAAPLPQDPRLRSCSGGKASNRAVGTSTSARVRTCAPDALLPSRLLLASRTQLVPPDFPSSIPCALDTPRPVHPVPVHLNFYAPVPGNAHTQDIPRLGHPTF